MTGDKLVASVKELLTNEQLYINSRKIMEQLKTEDGVANAIDVVENIQ
jgi:UDP:flavonoid glycosyltransferase YjiC (YdhE family)